MVTLLDMLNQQDPEKRRKMAWEKALQDLGTAGHPMSISPLGILYRTYRDGPAALGQMWETIKTPGDIAAGKKPATVEDAAKFALDVGLVGLTGTAPKGALRAGVSRHGVKPIKVYHGSYDKFTVPDLSKVGTRTDAGQLGRGFYVSTDPRVMKTYPHKYEATITPKNPLRVKLPDMRTNKQNVIKKALGIEDSADIATAAREAGYDSVILDYSPTGYSGKEIVVFDNSIIKGFSEKLETSQ